MFTMIGALAVNCQRSTIMGGIRIDIDFLIGGPLSLSYDGQETNC
jgi:hypothetical protein